MADLLDRLSGAGELETPVRPSINLHRFMAAERLYALSLFTRAQIATEFNLIGLEATQASQIADQIDLNATGLLKTIYINRADAVLLCVNDAADRLYHDVNGVVNKSLCFTHLLIVGS